MNNSNKMSLNKNDWNSIIHSGLVFLAPLFLIYLAQVTGGLQQANHVFTLKDFVPSSFTTGAIVLFAANRMTDIVRKFVA